MASTLSVADASGQPPAPGDPWWSRALRVLGWTLIAAGVIVGLFVIYLLFWTDRETAAAQTELLDDWESVLLPDAVPEVWEPDLRDLANIPVRTDARPPADEAEVPVDVGDSYALMWFQRGDSFIVTDGPVAAVQGVTLDDLTQGPGHYPDTEAPGEAGNVSFAGHRTTYGRPFHNIDQLRAGDEIHLVDGEGNRWVYDFLELQIVEPTDVWVIEDDAIPGVSHLLTLTSCHPKYSAAQRIIAFAELRQGPGASPDDEATSEGPTPSESGSATAAAAGVHDG